MKPSGVLIALAGIWLGVQILAGGALARLGIAGDAPLTSTPGASGRSGLDGSGSAGSGSAGGGGGTW